MKEGKEEREKERVRIHLVYNIVYCILYTYGIDSLPKTIVNQSQNVSLVFLLTLLSINFNDYIHTNKFLN